MNIDELTIGEIKQIELMLKKTNEAKGLNCMIGQKVIIRTYSAGVWFGVLSQKDRNEVILINARRMYFWWAKNGISLSAVAIYGINKEKSKIIEAIGSVWLEAIEIIPCTNDATLSIESAYNVKAE